MDTPFPPSESWIIRDPDDEKLVGHIGVIYIPCQYRGTSVAVGKTENTFGLPIRALQAKHDPTNKRPGIAMQAKRNPQNQTILTR
ncbi:hypothetical protein [Desulfoferula mesophila]|uniref:Uncharacterized protein n=1 Tax=Desulfoferula mesophila TaxID=3058419 RepID=A0AAU9ENK3_9BACT|nr:hypothetical protein FAK_05910 [Desulfoferula mesophilus]